MIFRVFATPMNVLWSFNVKPSKFLRESQSVGSLNYRFVVSAEAPSIGLCLSALIESRAACVWLCNPLDGSEPRCRVWGVTSARRDNSSTSIFFHHRIRRPKKRRPTTTAQHQRQREAYHAIPLDT